MEKPQGFLESLVSWLKSYNYGYCSGHPCLVRVVGLNLTEVSIIKAEKSTKIDITCGVMINDDLLYLIFLTM